MTSSPTPASVSVAFFLNHILPPLRPGLDATRVVERLRTTTYKGSKSITKLMRWSGCPRDPADSEKPLEKTFDFMVKLNEAIANACEAEVPGLVRLLHYRNNDNGCVTSSLGRAIESKPDAYLYRDGDEDYSTIGVVGEFTRTDSQRDVQDVSFSLSVCLCSTDESSSEHYQNYQEYG